VTGTRVTLYDMMTKLQIGKAEIGLQ
jgi:hypothetical protein